MSRTDRYAGNASSHARVIARAPPRAKPDLARARTKAPTAFAQCSFYEYRGYKVIYRRYASLFFIVGVEGEDEVSAPSSARSVTTLPRPSHPLPSRPRPAPAPIRPSSALHPHLPRRTSSRSSSSFTPSWRRSTDTLRMWCVDRGRRMAPPSHPFCAPAACSPASALSCCRPRSRARRARAVRARHHVQPREGALHPRRDGATRALAASAASMRRVAAPPCNATRARTSRWPRPVLSLGAQVMNGCIIETNKNNILAPVHLLDKTSL